MRENWDFNYSVASRHGSKTLRCAEDVHEFAQNKDCRIAIVGETISEVIETMVTGPNGILQTAKPENPVVYVVSKRRLEWPETGAQAMIFSYDLADRLWGHRMQGIWDEAETEA
jgi:phage terminase large subunit-like protein